MLHTYELGHEHIGFRTIDIVVTIREPRGSACTDPDWLFAKCSCGGAIQSLLVRGGFCVHGFLLG